MKLTINGIRGINNTFELKSLNVFSGLNGAGKSTVLQIVKDLLQGKTTIKEGAAILDMDGQVINMQNGIIFNSPKINIRDLGFLSGKGKQVKGINSTKEDRRNTIFNLLNIKQFEGDIKGLTGQLKECQTKESTLINELMEKESLGNIEIKKPKEVKLIQGTIGNQGELDRLQNRYKDLQNSIEDIPSVLNKPTEVILTQGNESEYNILKSELANIVTEGKNIPDTCSTCGQSIVNAEKMKQALRIKYNEKSNEIKNFVIIQSNLELYEQYRNDLELYNQSITRKTNVESRNIDIENQLKVLDKEIKEFKLVTETKGNEVEYEEYQKALSDYNANEAIKENRLQDIESLKTKIKNIPTIEIKSNIEKYRADELEFVKSIQDKLTIGDIEIKVFKELKSPNTNGEMFKSDFIILYKGKEYDELSTGQQIICDIVIEKLFMDIEGSELLLIDSAEISTENLKKVVSDLKGITILCTRITDKELELKYKF